MRARDAVSISPYFARRLAGMARCASLCLAVLATLVFIGSVATAREQSEEFVTGLRERGMYELAVDYLSQMESSRLADDEFRGRIGYHRGMTLVEWARNTADRDQRSQRLDEAKSELNRFATANPSSSAGADAMLELANVSVEVGKQSLAEAALLPSSDAYAEERNRIRIAARRAFDEAAPLFRVAEKFYSDALDQMPKSLDPKNDNEKIDQRQDYRGKLAQVSILAAQAQFERAGTYDPKSKEFRQLNEAAAKELGPLYEKYSRWLIGFYARLYEGRCYQALGDHQRALGCYEELISQVNVHPAFRKLIASAHGYQAQCLIAQRKYDNAIANCNNWLNDAHGAEDRSPEWLMVRYELAQALQLKAADSETKASDKRRALAEARDAYRLVAATPNEFQRAAREAVAVLSPKDDRKRDEPRNFAAAYEAGKEAMSSLNAAKMALPTAERNNPAALPELRDQIENGKSEALRNFELALSHVDDDTDRDQLNEVRYFLCWLCWDNKDFYRAAVLGEFLARRYPDHPTGVPAAKLTLAAYEQLQRAASATANTPQDTEFEARKMAEVADFITRRWPNTPAAETAFRVLVSFAIRKDRIEDATALLDKVSPEARPALEAQLGNAMWARYLELSQPSNSSRPDDAKMQELRTQAINLLQSGYDTARKSGKVTEVGATAGLYLAQAALSDGKYSDAIALLEEAKIGPLALVQDKKESAARPEYGVEVYKAALRAYVLTTPPQAKKAIDIMRRLEDAVASGDAQADQLARIYSSLALALNEQLRELRDSGRDAEAARVSHAFGDFLDQVADRQKDANWPTRFSLAQTYFTMGEALEMPSDADNKESSAARKYFSKARDLYRKLVDEVRKEPSVAPNTTATFAARKQLGESQRKLGEYDKALDTFAAILADQEGLLPVQESAARSYQEWGESGDVKYLEQAIQGGYKAPGTDKNRVWGWLKLALVAEKASRANPTYATMFFEARLEAARCRYLVGTKAADAEKQKNFTTAKQSMRSMLQLYPDLGGEQRQAEFNELLKQIQTAGGEEPVGLKEFGVEDSKS